LEHYNFVKENIWKYFKVERSEQETILKELEVPVSLCLGEIERRGILLDVNELRSLNKEMDEEISYVKTEMFDCIGHEVNINSPNSFRISFLKNYSFRTEERGQQENLFCIVLLEYILQLSIY
jgi:DNA polymerase I-like protein with 3'-5' exonuclease and polymerase domains